LIADLADLQAGRGWGGSEFPGLGERLAGFGDVTLMLALVHHLAISHGIPYAQIASLARAVTSGALVVELVGPEDPMVAVLCAQRRRAPREFALEGQRAAFAAHFRLVDEVALPGGARRLLLLEAA
jgi:hypothetical protein